MSKKICLLIDRLNSGGAEKMVTNLSKSFINKGYEVTTVIMRDDVVYDYAGKLYNFGVIKVQHSRIKSLKIFKSFFEKENFDIILDHRVRMFWIKEFLFSKYVFKKFSLIYGVHHYDLSLYFPLASIPFLSKLTLVKNRRIIAVSKMAKQEIEKKLKLKSQVIYNYPEEKASIEKVDVGFEYIIAVGRLEKIKQFDVLIKAYKSSKLSKAQNKLLIFGEGSQYDNLQSLIAKYNLKNFVILKGFSTNIDSYMQSAKALIMSSKNEGFPMVLIEAIQLKTPVVSFDCKSGPSEIIENEVNGLLVKNQDVDALSKALNRLLNFNFYNQLKNNLEHYNSPFTEEKIIQQWIDLIETS